MVITRSDAPACARGFKLCRKCDTVKGLREFQRNRSRVDGRQTKCRDCNNAYATPRARVNKNKREYDRAYKAAHAERYREHFQNWKVNNRERKRELDYAHTKRRRALKANADTDGWTRADVLRVAEESDAYGCTWCGGPAGGDWHADHVYPLSRGGVDRLENIVIACQDCNLSKSNKLPFEEWTP